MKKINPYIIIIIVLLIAVAGFLYDKWGNGILPGSVKSTDKSAVKVELFEDDIEIGNKDAPVTIVEYYSYLCSYCELFHEQTYPRILEDYITTGKVKYVFRPYPPYELSTAILCANEQDEFFEYHDIVFKNSGNIEKEDDLKELAEKAGLEIGEFNQCFDSQKYLDRAKEWYQQGQDDFERAGVAPERRGTPAFFINDEALVGAQPYESFVEVIERKLSE